MISLMPFDLLYLQFGFRSIFRANRLLKVNALTCIHCSCASSEHLRTNRFIRNFCRACTQRQTHFLNSAIVWRASWPRPTSGGRLSCGLLLTIIMHYLCHQRWAVQKVISAQTAHDHFIFNQIKSFAIFKITVVKKTGNHEEKQD